jgi:hypothetical protein
MRFWFLMITSWPGSLVAERQQILCLAWTFSVYYTHWCLRCAALPLKKIRWSEGGRLQGRAHAPRTIGRTLQESGCNLFFFQKCLCKIWDVNYQKFIWNINPVSIKNTESVRCLAIDPLPLLISHRDIYLLWLTAASSTSCIYFAHPMFRIIGTHMVCLTSSA